MYKDRDHLLPLVKHEALVECKDGPSEGTVCAEEDDLEQGCILRKNPDIRKAKPICPVAEIHEEEMLLLFAEV